MKWYSTENTQGKEDYSAADAMLGFTSHHGISVRGHNIFWDDPKYQLGWVNNLSPNDLRKATDRRLNSLVSRYAGKVIAWDVNNENLHFNYFESKLGGKITDVFFQKTQQLDRRTTLFMNDYNTIEDERDTSSSPSKYIQKIKEIQGFLGGSALLGIGLEGHFSTQIFHT
ncbi:Anti-sigma-I factor RsgI6 [Bienertia sinuspersici]